MFVPLNSLLSYYFLIGVKTDMEERQKAWKKEQDDHSEIFRKLCKCRKKTLGKGDEDIVLSVAKKQLEFLLRVNFNEQSRLKK